MTKQEVTKIVRAEAERAGGVKRLADAWCVPLSSVRMAYCGGTPGKLVLAKLGFKEVKTKMYERAGDPSAEEALRRGQIVPAILHRPFKCNVCDTIHDASSFAGIVYTLDSIGMAHSFHPVCISCQTRG